MMGHRDILVDGGEYDIVTGWRKLLKCTKRPGYCRYYKRKINRRARREAKSTLRDDGQ